MKEYTEALTRRKEGDTRDYSKLTMRQTKPFSNSLAHILHLLEILPTSYFGNSTEVLKPGLIVKEPGNSEITSP